MRLRLTGYSANYIDSLGPGMRALWRPHLAARFQYVKAIEPLRGIIHKSDKQTSGPYASS